MAFITFLNVFQSKDVFSIRGYEIILLPVLKRSTTADNIHRYRISNGCF